MQQWDKSFECEQKNVVSSKGFFSQFTSKIIHVINSTIDEINSLKPSLSMKILPISNFTYQTS